MNTLLYGDSFPYLREFETESVDLVYLDPPFELKSTYNLLFRTPHGDTVQAQTAAFQDTWWWTSPRREHLMTLSPPAREHADSCRPAELPARQRSHGLSVDDGCSFDRNASLNSRAKRAACIFTVIRQQVIISSLFSTEFLDLRILETKSIGRERLRTVTLELGVAWRIIFCSIQRGKNSLGIFRVSGNLQDTFQGNIGMLMEMGDFIMLNNTTSPYPT